MCPCHRHDLMMCLSHRQSALFFLLTFPTNITDINVGEASVILVSMNCFVLFAVMQSYSQFLDQLDPYEERDQ